MKYSIQCDFLRVSLILSDSSNPILEFLHSYCSTSLLFSLQSSCFWGFFFQHPASLLHFLSSFATICNKDTGFPFCPCILVFLIVDTREGFDSRRLSLCYKPKYFGISLALTEKLLDIIHIDGFLGWIFLGWIFSLGLSYLYCSSVQRKDTSWTVHC